MKPWQAIKGAAKYATALAIGDVADDGTAGARLRTCAACPSRKRYIMPSGFRTLWCGTPFEPVAGAACGCLIGAGSDADSSVAVTIEGAKYEPAGKLSVRSELCPRGAW